MTMLEFPNTKYTVTKLVVSDALQKIRFQVRHPEDVHCITGIAVSVDYSGAKGTIGFIALAVPGKGDVFYTDDFKSITTKLNEAFRDYIFPGELNIFFAGWRREYFETHIPVCETILEGYYENLAELDSAASGGSDETYNVSLYLRYERNKPKNDC